MTRFAPALTLVLASLAGCVSSPPATGETLVRAPAFSAVDTNGRDVSLAAFHDQVLILDFWAVW